MQDYQGKSPARCWIRILPLSSGPHCDLSNLQTLAQTPAQNWHNNSTLALSPLTILQPGRWAKRVTLTKPQI